MTHLCENTCCYQQRDEGWEADDGEATGEGVGDDGSDDRKHGDASIDEVVYLSCTYALDVEFLNQVNDQVGNPSPSTKC